MRIAVARVSACTRIEPFAAGFAHGADKGVCAFRLDDGKFWQTGYKAESVHFEQCLADGGTVAEISAGDDDVIGCLPVQLLHQFECESFLPFQAERIDGVQLADRRVLHQFLEKTQTSIEIGAQLAGESTVIESLGKFAPGNFSLRHKDKAAHAAARRIRRHGSGCVACGSTDDPAVSRLASEAGGNRHAGVFERASRVHALMLRVKACYPGAAGALRKFVQRGVALAQGDDVCFGRRR